MMPATDAGPTMDDLSADDLDRLMAGVRTLYAPETLDRFPHRLLGVLRGLIGCTFSVYEETNLPRNRSFGISDPFEARSIERLPAFDAYMHEHPLISRFAAGDERVLTISDFMTRAQWHNSALQNEYFRDMNVEDQLGIVITNRQGLMIGTAVARDRRSFTARDRRIMELLRPHVRQAYANAELLTDLRLSEETATIGDVPGQSGAISLAFDGTPRLVSAAAEELLHRFFPNEGRAGRRVGPLPAELAEWLTRHFDSVRTGDFSRPLRPWQRRHAAHGTLTARLMPFGHTPLLLLAHTPPPARQDPRVAALSPRLRQVLDLLLDGHGEKQVAGVLGLSPHTVHRHVTRLYRTLDVAGRSELMARFVR